MRSGLDEFLRRLAEGRPRSDCLAALSDCRDLSSVELAYLENVSRRTLEDWAERGDGPPFRKAGGRRNAPRRYPLREYLDWREDTVLRATVERHRQL